MVLNGMNSSRMQLWGLTCNKLVSAPTHPWTSLFPRVCIASPIDPSRLPVVVALAALLLQSEKAGESAHAELAGAAPSRSWQTAEVTALLPSCVSLLLDSKEQAVANLI